MAASPRDGHVLYTMLVLGGDMRFIFGGDGRSIKSAFGRVMIKFRTQLDKLSEAFWTVRTPSFVRLVRFIGRVVSSSKSKSSLNFS